MTLHSSLLVSAFALGLVRGACAMEHELLSTLPQVRYPQENRVVSGAIDAGDVQRLKKAGVRHVIDLRPASENPGFDERQAVTERELMYYYIPVRGGESLTKENAEALDETLSGIGDEPALLHCSSGNRVGALIAVREAWINGASAEAAIVEGRRWGLTQLEDKVRELLIERNSASR